MNSEATEQNPPCTHSKALGVGVVVPGAHMYPGWQAAHAMSPSLLYVPSMQTIGAAAASAHANPAGQRVQFVAEPRAE